MRRCRASAARSPIWSDISAQTSSSEQAATCSLPTPVATMSMRRAKSSPIWEEVERRASGEYQTPRGLLTITMPIEFGHRYVLPIALDFMNEHPEVTLKLLSLDRSVHLANEQVDVAIRLGELVDSSLYAVKAGEFRLLTCASPAYL